MAPDTFKESNIINMRKSTALSCTNIDLLSFPGHCPVCFEFLRKCNMS